jgi:hypothetical protein
MSCGWPDLNLETEITDAIGELGCGPAWVTAGEMVGAEILAAGAVGQHVIGGGQDRGRHGESSFFGTAPCLEPQELSLKVAILLASRARHTEPVRVSAMRRLF